jgi:hypothetical protein
MSNNIAFIINCPHCNEHILIEELNCKIFRHAVLKSTNQQIDPHSSKSECDNYIINNLIYGCGKPFKILILNNNYQAEICDYI